jgi:cytidine deaminase
VLPPDEARALIDAACGARERAYAPYSRFKVGAALLDEHGRIHAGCNIENAAYPQGLCAEAAALAHLVMAGGQRVRAVAVAGDVPGGITPCGGCRQKLREFADDATPVLACSLHGERARYTLGGLLPASFGPEQLSITRSADDPR